MKVKSQNIALEGFNRIQETVMRLKLAKRTLPPGDITISLSQDIIDGHCDYTWYGGLIAEIGGSDVSIIYGVSHFRSNRELYYDKL